MREILSDGFAALGLDLTEDMLSAFETYNAYLGEQNAVMNLTTIKGDEDVARLHFLDCVSLLPLWDFSGKKVIDVGSGAGFPGLPIRIADPSVRMTLLDSQQKRVAFLERTCDKLGYDDVSCVWNRAEQASHLMAQSFDISVARAVAKLNILCELCLPFVKPGGVFIAMKGPDCVSELKESAHAIAVLGGGKSEIKTYTVPGTDITHSAVIIHKAKPTPAIYPRQFGRIKNCPL